MAVSLAELDPAARHRAISQRFGEVIAATTDWDAPAPVKDWTAQDVVDHLIGWVPGFLSAGGVEFEATIGNPEDRAAAWQTLSAAIQNLLDDPGRSGAPFTDQNMGTMTVTQALDNFYTPDVFMHTWDLMRAGGMEPHLDPGYCTAVYTAMEPFDAMMRASGQFGPKVPVPDDADPQTRLMAFVGRDPNWQPPS